MNILLFIVLVFSILVCSAQLTAENQLLIQQQFAAEVEEYCLPPSCSTKVPLAERVTNIKMLNYLQKVRQLELLIEDVMESGTFKLVEGSTIHNWEKLSILSKLADDMKVRNICEVGFNAGHSSLNFLISNPNATLLVFDIFEHHYVSAAVRSLKDLFSERKITVVAGDSTKSIPDFTSVRDPSFQCQLTFIDGGHTRAVFEADLRHMKQLADPAFHVVVVDDLDMGDVLEVFQVGCRRAARRLIYARQPVRHG